LEHIATSELLDVAAGNVQLNDNNRQHLHECERCQHVLRMIVTNQIDNPLSNTGETKSDAAA
jgi:hypothetical protein